MLRRQLIMSGVAALPLAYLAACNKPAASADNAVDSTNSAINAAGGGKAASKAPHWLQAVKNFLDAALTKAASKTTGAISTKLKTTQQAFDDMFNEDTTDTSVVEKILSNVNDILVLLDTWAPGFIGIVGTIIEIIVSAIAAALGITLKVSASSATNTATSPSSSGGHSGALLVGAAPLVPLFPAAAVAQARKNLTAAEEEADKQVSPVLASDEDLANRGDKSVKDLKAAQDKAFALIDSAK